MTGSLCRRLLAAVLLIFVVQLLQLLLRAQSAPVPFAVARRSALARPNLDDSPRIEFDESYRVPVFPAPGPFLPRHSPLAQIARPAGIIFSGRVMAVGRSDSSGGRDPASTTITFQVGQAIRGVSAGQTLTIHEWAGLWAKGERYRVGERVVLFLFPPSRLGLTSPVAGPWGRFEIDRRGRVVLNAYHAGILESHAQAGAKNVVPYPEFVLALRRAVEEE
jgi:hypothetical protein